MENYSFLVLCNPGERTTGEWPRVWQVAQTQLGLWELLPQAGPAGSALNQDRSQPGTVQSMEWALAALLGLSCSGWCRGCSPCSCGSAGAAAALLGDFISVCVSIRAWRSHGSRTSLSPVVPRPVHRPVTLDFVWHCQHEPCFQKSPTKFKKHHVVNRHLSCGAVCWLRLHHSHSLVNNSHCEFLGLAALRSAVWCFSRRSSVNWAPSSSPEPTLLKVCACEFSLSY